MNNLGERKDVALDISVLLILVFVALVKINPLNILMTNDVQMMLLCVLAVWTAIFTSFIWRAKPHDERELAHQYISGKVGFAAGNLTIIVLLLVSIFTHADTRPIVLVLAVSNTVKIVTGIWLRMKQ